MAGQVDALDALSKKVQNINARLTELEVDFEHRVPGRGGIIVPASMCTCSISLTENATFCIKSWCKRMVRDLLYFDWAEYVKTTTTTPGFVVRLKPTGVMRVHPPGVDLTIVLRNALKFADRFVRNGSVNYITVRPDHPDNCPDGNWIPVEP